MTSPASGAGERSARRRSRHQAGEPLDLMVGRRDGTLLITGGAGFIGSHLTDLALACGHRVLVLDALTYAGSLGNLDAARRQPGFAFVKGDIADRALVEDLLAV